MLATQLRRFCFLHYSTLMKTKQKKKENNYNLFYFKRDTELYFKHPLNL